jgi:heme/copper-type cytochrome/quinol oxidase subunit 1
VLFLLLGEVEALLIRSQLGRAGHLGVGVVTVVANLLWSAKHGRRAGSDPRQGNTLEWFTPSPPPPNNFNVIPRVRSVEPMKDIRREVAASARPPKLSPTRPPPAVHDDSGADPVRGGGLADRGGRLDLGLDAVEQLAVGVAE